MMVENMVETKIPNVNEKLKNLITFHANCELSLSDLCSFTEVVYAIEYQLIQEHIDFSMLNHINIIFTKRGNFSIKENTGELGAYFCVIVYKLELLNKTCEDFKYFAFAEELVHHFWQITDETIVKIKTLEIMKLLNRNITIETLNSWGVNWK